MLTRKEFSIWHSVLSAVFVISAGTLLHFAWNWSGKSTVVAVFAATNESTWEHLKLAFWPALVLTLVQHYIYRAYPSWLPAAAIRCLLPALLITALFYGYTAVLARHHLAADLLIFAISILAGEFMGYATLSRRFGSKAHIAALGLLFLATAAFSSFTFWPPDLFLFRPPSASVP